MKDNFKRSDLANEKMKLASFPLVTAAGRGFVGKIRSQFWIG